MSHVVTEVTTMSWGARMKGAIGGICFGIILFFGSFPLLVWNEGRSVERYQSLEEGKKTVVPIANITAAVDPNREGQLVHLSGTAKAGSNVSDSLFGVDPPNILKLERDVEMYQWRESKSQRTEKTNGGGTRTVTTYSYDKVWSSHVINSASFHEPESHENPSGGMIYPSLVLAAHPINIGSYVLSDDLVDKINWFSDLPGGVSSVDKISDDSVRGKAKQFGNGFFFGDDPSYPEVGDTKVSFRQIPEGAVTVVGAQSGDSFAPYLTHRGGTVLLLRRGPHTSEEMFLLAERDNAVLTWILRFVGFFVMFLGLKMMVQPLEVMADVIPVIGPCAGDLVGAATGALVGLIAGVLSAVTIALSWLFYRPLFSVLFLAVAAALFYYLKKNVDERRRASSSGFASAPAYEITKGNDLELGKV